MVAISAKEKNIIAKKMPNIHIRRTVMQKSKRHHYYMEENKGALHLLASLRAAS